MRECVPWLMPPSPARQVIIAGAGGAAHLPGMVAAMTPVPVVGVPVKTTALSGNDSLLSIVQVRGAPRTPLLLRARAQGAEQKGGAGGGVARAIGQGDGGGGRGF